MKVCVKVSAIAADGLLIHNFTGDSISFDSCGNLQVSESGGVEKFEVSYNQGCTNVVKDYQGNTVEFETDVSEGTIYYLSGVLTWSPLPPSELFQESYPVRRKNGKQKK